MAIDATVDDASRMSHVISCILTWCGWMRLSYRIYVFFCRLLASAACPHSTVGGVDRCSKDSVSNKINCCCGRHIDLTGTN